ncbi:ABC transporter ATP-binding protein [Haloferax namakaokahaiae]|uniref:Probable branched-chain amino acid transport ATP-binding protein LivG n=1 Tax=Haloferax namakaokahaiae TaxID=1748331 RepID=A0ABD5ZCW1_9EURY
MNEQIQRKRDESQAHSGDEDLVLWTDGLSKLFGGIVALDDVNLSVERGELHAIIGPNGAGKTTLFNTVTGKLDPSEGSVWFDGEEITDLPQEERPHLGLARSFQSNQLFNDLTVLENIRIVVQTVNSGSFDLDLLGDGQSKFRDRAFEHLERVGLDDQHGVKTTNLSHGDQRRLGIAIALATEPSVLLLDEPTSGMGATETRETANMIDELQAELGLTILLIEHDMDIVLSMSDRITVLNQGEILATGPPDEIRENEAVQNAYLGGMREEL